MEQQLYGSKGEAPGLRDEMKLPLNQSCRPFISSSIRPSVQSIHPSMNGKQGKKNTEHKN
jgi:hypothetical protein